MANMNRYNKDRAEMIKTRRRKAGIEEVETESREIAVPTTFKEKAQNFWYHYKKIVIAVVFVTVVAAVGLFSMFSRPAYDVSFIVITEQSFSGSKALFVPALRGFAPDVNENGTVEIEFLDYQIGGIGTTTTEMVNMTYAQIIGRVSGGTDFIFLLDEVGYENLKSVEMEFVDISVFTGSDEPQGDKYYLEGKDIRKKIGLNEGLDHMFLCFVDIESFAENRQNNAEVKTAHDAQWEMFKGIIEYN